MQKIIILVSLLTFTLVASEIIVLRGAQMTYPDGYPDPFASYEAIMPGQPSAALDDYPCNFPDMGTGTPYCVIAAPPNTPFTSINVYFYNHTIHQISFNSTGIHFIDLIGRWGYPTTIQRHHDYFFAQWGTTVVATVQLAERFHLRLPVMSVSIRD